MQVFRVDDMTCGHCAGSITEAVQAVDADARVVVDLARHLVTVEGERASAAEVASAITEAGYTAIPVEHPGTASAAARAGGCCCGSRASRCGG